MTVPQPHLTVDPSSGDMEEEAAAKPSSRPRIGPYQLLSVALIGVPVAFLGAMGWRHRWLADDAFIHLRVVSQILAGHGPVFNAGERVEASTSAAWVALLTAGSIFPMARETLAIFLGLGLSLWALVAAQWGALALTRLRGKATIILPVGAIVVAALPPFWDFATSGMETGLELAWLATVFLGVSRFIRDRHSDLAGRVPAWLALAAGLGPLIRPDLALFSLAYVAVLAWLGRASGWRGIVRVILIAAALPVAYELFRMGYYATIVPNTALAKSAAGADWVQGWRYLQDFIAPYWLWLPLVVGLGLSLVLIVRLRRSGRQESSVLIVALLAASGLYTIYVVRLGGDFMHARLLLPAVFAALLPVAAVEMSLATTLSCAVVIGWAIPCALAFRTPYPTVNVRTGIANEANFWRFDLATRNPVMAEDWRRLGWPADAHALARDAAGGARVLRGIGPDFPLAPGVKQAVVAWEGNIGVVGYIAGSGVYIEDPAGLADPVASRLEVVQRGRPGHERLLPAVWVLGRFTAPSWWREQPAIRVQDVPEGSQLIPSAGIAGVNRALGCGQLRELVTAVSAPLTPGRFVQNVIDSVKLTRLRIPQQPNAAAEKFCH